ncbi:MAG: YtxH domain-containing protein [Candidatus Eisenbacteria bacterium]
MSENRTDSLMAFLLGAALGAGVALLLAPASGDETRRKLSDRARSLGDEIDDKIKTAKDEVKHRAGDVKAAVGAGRDAYIRARAGDEPASTSNVL